MTPAPDDPHPEDLLPSAALTYTLGIVVTAILIGIAAAAYVYLQPGQPPRRPVVPPPTAATPQPPPPESLAPTLTITSTPLGATVMVGNLELGTTPVALDVLEPGREYRLRLYKEGYVKEEVVLSLEQGVAERNIVLTKK